MENVNLLPIEAQPNSGMAPIVWGDAQAAMNVLVQQAHALGIYAGPNACTPVSQNAGVLHGAS